MCAETKGARQMTSYQPSSTLTKDWETQEQYIHYKLLQTDVLA